MLHATEEDGYARLTYCSNLPAPKDHREITPRHTESTEHRKADSNDIIVQVAALWANGRSTPGQPNAEIYKVIATAASNYDRACEEIAQLNGRR